MRATDYERHITYIKYRLHKGLCGSWQTLTEEGAGHHG